MKSLNQNLLDSVLKLSHNVAFVENGILAETVDVVEDAALCRSWVGKHVYASECIDEGIAVMLVRLVDLYLAVRAKIGAVYLATGILLEARIDVGSFPPPTRSQADALVDRSMNRMHVADSVKKLKGWGDRTVRSTIAEGFEKRQTPARIAREVGKRLGDPKAYRTLVRTAVQQVNNASLADSFENNRGYLRGLQYVAALDTRTCLVCQADDGKVYAYEKPFVDGDAVRRPWVPRHPLCRCTYTGVVKDINLIAAEMDVSVESFPPGTRKTVDGQLAEKTNYRDWIGKQDEATQRAALGKKAYGLFKKGVPIAQFADRGRTLTVKELDRLSPTEIAEVPEVATIDTPAVTVPAQPVVVTSVPPRPAPIQATTTPEKAEALYQKIAPKYVTEKWSGPDANYAEKQEAWVSSVLKNREQKKELWRWYTSPDWDPSRMDAILKTAPEFKGAVYRGINVKDLKTLQKFRRNATVTFDALSSASRKRFVAMEFTGAVGKIKPVTPNEGRVIFKIRSLTARDVSAFPSKVGTPEYAYQKELLFRKGSSFKVRRVRTEQIDIRELYPDMPSKIQGYTVVELEELRISPKIVLKPKRLPKLKVGPPVVKERWRPIRTETEIEERFLAATRSRVHFEGYTTKGKLKVANDIGADVARVKHDFPKIAKMIDDVPIHRSDFKNLKVLENHANGTFYHGTRRIQVATKGKVGVSGRPTLGDWTTGRSTTDIYRHEMGHSLESNVLAPRNRWRANVYRTESKERWKRLVSEYGAKKPDELWCESFSAYTHPRYGVAGKRLPKVIEDFMKEFIGVHPNLS